MARALFTSRFKRYLTQLYHVSTNYPFWNDVDTWPEGAVVWDVLDPAPTPPAPLVKPFLALSTNTDVKPDSDPTVWEETTVPTQRWWRRTAHHRLPKWQKQPDYPYGPHHTGYDEEASLAYGNWRMVFLQLTRAWQNGSGYAWGNTARDNITIDYTAWNDISSAYLYQRTSRSYWHRNAYQWFMAYNLAAAAVNGNNGAWGPTAYQADISLGWVNYFFGPHYNRLLDSGHPMCFVGAPLPTYNPIRITAAKRYPDDMTDADAIYIRPTPNLGAYLASDNPPTPQDVPVLLMNAGPTVRGPISRGFRTRSRCFEQPWWDFYISDTDGAYTLRSSLVTQSSPYSAPVLCEIRYVRNAAPWLANGDLIPCAEPGPPFRLSAQALGVVVH